jgi:hypothetical protein
MRSEGQRIVNDIKGERDMCVRCCFYFKHARGLFFCLTRGCIRYAERCSELQQQSDTLRRDLEAAHVNNAHLLRVRSILELSEKRLAEAVAQVVSHCFRCCF